jgi:hypothetical protein
MKGIWDLHAVCVRILPPSPSPTSNGWTSLYETWYVYRGNWAHLNGVLHKTLPSVCVYVYAPIIARQRLGKSITVATNTHATTEELLHVCML